MKPSEFCKSKLKLKNVKSYEFVREYFRNVDILVAAIHKYCSVSKVRGNEKTLADLLQ